MHDNPLTFELVDERLPGPPAEPTVDLAALASRLRVMLDNTDAQFQAIREARDRLRSTEMAIEAAIARELRSARVTASIHATMVAQAIARIGEPMPLAAYIELEEGVRPDRVQLERALRHLIEQIEAKMGITRYDGDR